MTSFSQSQDYNQALENGALLSAGMVHDLNNLLTIINGYHEILLSSSELPESARRTLEAARAAGERAAALTRALMTTSRAIPLEVQPIDINECVNDVAATAGQLLPPNVELVPRLAPDLRAVMADRGGMLQVLLNLVLNARDAMAGRIEISSVNLRPDHSSSPPHPYLPAGAYVLLTVRDDGAGMDEATRQRIFEPYYTTKRDASGAGLGLPMVQHIVKQTGGFLSVDSAPGKGTAFRIYLPAVKAELSLEPAPLDPSAPRGETILVVENDAGLCRLLTDLLSDAGYAVLDAPSADEGLEMSAALRDRLDLLVIEAALTERDADVMTRLRESRPGVPALYLGAPPSGESVPGAEYLAKPFTEAELTRQVRAILERKKPKRVLVVDDDEQIVIFASSVLRNAGYEVLAGDDGNAALTIAQRERLDLVITDLVMREREGLDTVMRLRESHPELPVIAMSGAFGGYFLRSASILGARATLAKPFSGEDLLGVVRTVLGN